MNDGTEQSDWRIPLRIVMTTVIHQKPGFVTISRVELAS